MLAALTIAGSDAGGGAGIQADLKTFEALGVFGTTAITAVTAQNTLGVWGVWPMAPEAVASQAKAVLEDLPVRAVKTGMLANAGIVAAVQAALQLHPTLPLVIDPVMIATSGHRLLDADARAALEAFIPRATVLTPNLPEAAQLLQVADIGATDLVAAAQALHQRYGCAVLLKGGHAHTPDSVTDVLAMPGAQPLVLQHPRLALARAGQEAHGTGCTLSAAIAAGLANGLPLAEAVLQARHYLQLALAQAPQGMGQGSQPLKHSVSWPAE
jgi:hydroxymethylpyrimidine/phosphomethylpyrimidine kinase